MQSHPCTPGKSCSIPADFVHELHNAGSATYVPPNRWCITRDDLDFFEKEVRHLWQENGIPQSETEAFYQEGHDDPRFGPNIHQTVTYCIKPVTAAAGGMSWALMRHPRGLECTIFATHCWNEGVFECIKGIKDAWPSFERAGHLWVCFLANPQNSDIARVIGTKGNAKLRDSPFAVALDSARHMLVIPNSKVSIYGRLWCVFEAHYALPQVQAGCLTLELPAGMDTCSLLHYVVPRIFLSAICIVIIWCLPAWCQVPSYFFGPLTWMVSGVLSGECCLYMGRMIGNRYLEGLALLQFELALVYTLFIILGITSGVSFLAFQRRTLHDGLKPISSKLFHFDATYLWAHGEEQPWAIFTILLFCMYLNRTVTHLVDIVAYKAGQALSFETVRKAVCTDSADQRRIEEEIRGKEDEIDAFIKAFKNVGRFNRGVMASLKLGIPARKLARNTFTQRCLKTLVACITWEFWRMTDCIAQGYVALAYCVLALTMLLFSTIVWLAGDYGLWAVDSFFYLGIAYVLASNHHSYQKYVVDDKIVSDASRFTRYVCFLLAMFSCVFVYSGCWSSIRDFLRRGSKARTHNEDDEDESTMLTSESEDNEN